MDTNELIVKEILKRRIKDSAGLALLKKEMAKKYRISMQKNVVLLQTYHKMIKNGIIGKKEKIESILRLKPVRSLSGVVNISVLTKPYPCPGNCLFCPSEKGMPKSYLKNEPAVMRAVLNKFDPYKQVKMRLRALKDMGHNTDKVELRIIGGTFSFYPKKYQEDFIKKCLDAFNNFYSSNLEKAQGRNQKAKHRVVSVYIETRPDFIDEQEIKRMRMLGVTGCELGVQSIYDDVLKKNRRGHSIKETVEATKLLKDSGFKVCYQMMPNLYSSTIKKDEKMFKELFRDERFKPDMLKIYPCVVLKDAPLFNLYKKNKYKPYEEEEMIKLIKKIKGGIPCYVRIQRLVRDIPQNDIVAGLKVTNLRQILQDQKISCKCIRCREVRGDYSLNDKLILFRKDYAASKGKEIFLSFETKNREKLYSLLRLRIPSNIISKQKHFLPVLDNAGIVREIHTYGLVKGIGQKGKHPQHQGLGKALLQEAERIVKKEFKLKKIAVISAIGTKEYYRKKRYKEKNSYMVKDLS